jgi:23S rRNA (guanosine2251-2'-O)-methyltransferase
MSNTTPLIYGFHAVFSCLTKQPERITAILVDQHRRDQRMQQLLVLAEQKKVEIKRQSRADLDKILDQGAHQGVIAFVKPQAHHEHLESFLDELTTPFLLVLDGVQDPHNLGACLRTANAAGVNAVIAPKDRAVGITPVVEKVASGATFDTPFFQVTNLARTLTQLKDRGIWLYGTSDHAETLYSEADYRGAVAIVMGSEAKGMRRLTEEHCDYLIRIPMLGTVSSLNVSVATGVCLFEVVRQQYEKN